jgi:hypothetical protein
MLAGPAGGPLAADITTRRARPLTRAERGLLRAFTETCGHERHGTLRTRAGVDKALVKVTDSWAEVHRAVAGARERVHTSASASIAIGGVTVARAEIQEAIDRLSGTAGTGIKPTLKAKGNPLAECDYHAIIREWKAQHPGTEGTAKSTFVLALKDKLAALA